MFWSKLCYGVIVAFVQESGLRYSILPSSCWAGIPGCWLWELIPKGPCAQITFWPQSTYVGTTLRPEYRLFGYMEPSGKLLVGYGPAPTLHYLKDPKLWEVWYIPYYG